MSGGERPAVVLIGPPGSGKSTVARALAILTGLPIRDTDGDIEHTAGKQVAQIFIDDGEEAFRALERQAVATALNEHSGILALGGGAVLDADTQARLAGHTVVFLDVSIAAAAPRVGFGVSRPLLAGNPRARWNELMAARRPVYESLATHTVGTDARTPAQIAAEIAERVGLAPVAGSGEQG